MRIFILEDDALRISRFKQAVIGLEWTIAESYDEAIKTFDPPYDMICLDHDLGGLQMVASDGDERTGYHFVTWMLDNYPNMPKLNQPILIHSYNYAGAERMAQALNSVGHQAFCIPFGPKVLHAIASLKREELV